MQLDEKSFSSSLSTLYIDFCSSDVRTMLSRYRKDSICSISCQLYWNRSVLLCVCHTYVQSGPICFSLQFLKVGFHVTVSLRQTRSCRLSSQVLRVALGYPTGFLSSSPSLPSHSLSRTSSNVVS